MIDVNGLSLNSSSSVEPAVMAQEIPKFQQITEQNEDQNEIETDLDSNSFILLMAQMLSDTSGKVEINDTSNVSSSENSAIALTSESSNPNPLLDGQVIKANQQTVIPLTENVALAWINSEHYKPQQSVSVAGGIEDGVVFEEDDGTSNQMGLLNVPFKAESNQKSLTDELFNLEVTTKNNLPDEPGENTSIIKLNDELMQSLKQLTSSSLTVSGHTSSEVETKQKIDGILQDNSPAVVHLNSMINHDNLNLITQTETQSLEIPVDINNSQWADKFSDQIVWLGQQGIKSALIKIHPEDLGPIEISIKVVKDSASVTINSHSSHVCSIVDQAMPRLREMMADQGLNLAEVHIGADTDPRQSQQQNSQSNQDFVHHLDEEIQTTPLNHRQTQGLIDYFA